MSRFNIGDEAWFEPRRGNPMKCKINSGKLIEVIVGTDPFPTTVRLSQIKACQKTKNAVSSTKRAREDPKALRKRKDKMTKTAPLDAKQLRKQAQGLSIKNWEDMTRSELAEAISQASDAENGAVHKPKKKTPKPTNEKKKTSMPKAKAAKPKTKSTKTKAPAKKVAAKTTTKKTRVVRAAELSESDKALGLSFAKSHPKEPLGVGENPFRKGSHLAVIATLLFKGGKREAIARKLSTKFALKPYKKGKEVTLSDYDMRMTLAAHTLRDTFGYGIQRVGRGIDGTVKVFVPGSSEDPRNSTKKTRVKKATKSKK